MILMWLGSFVLMVFGLAYSQKSIAALFANLQKAALERAQGPWALSAAVLEASPQKSLYTGMALYNLKIMGLRPACFLMCASPLGSWWALGLGLLYLSFNGFFLLGLCFLGLFHIGGMPRLKLLLKWIFAAGLFLIGGEMMLRNSSVIQTLLGQNHLAFFLADGRFGAVMTLLIVAAILSFFIRVEFWSLVLGLSLLTMGTLSLNGALGLVTGERIGRMLAFWWRTQGLSQESRRWMGFLTLFSVLGIGLGFLGAGVLRSLFVFEDKSLQLVFDVGSGVTFSNSCANDLGSLFRKGAGERSRSCKILLAFLDSGGVFVT